MTDLEALKILNRKDFENMYFTSDGVSNSIIKNKIQEIPNEYFEPRINVDAEGKTKISLIQFSLETVGMSSQKRNGLMQKYNINPYDMKKLQTIIDSIKVVQEYSATEKQKQNEEKVEKEYGFSLAANDELDKAYPLWLAYLFADSLNPLSEIEAKLKEDGMEDKYKPETIMNIIEHTESLMEGKKPEEKKDFYMQSISSILEKKTNILRDELEI